MHESDSKALMSDDFTISGIPMRIDGRVLRVVRAREEWDVDVEEPAAAIEEIRASGRNADVFTFMQRLPDSRPRFDYFREWDNVAALQIDSYDYWLNSQLHRNARNKLRKAVKAGVETREVAFDEKLFEGIRDIQNEIPIRQGRPYAYYGKDVDWIRVRYGTYLERARFVGAFYRGELVGFLKLVSAGPYTRTMGILAKLGCRDLAPMNLLTAKGVEICAQRGDPYLVYGKYDYGKVGADSVASYKSHSGFEHVLLPRYFVPLTLKGYMALQIHLHHGLIGYVPRPCVQWLRELKGRYFESRYRSVTAEVVEAGRRFQRGLESERGVTL